MNWLEFFFGWLIKGQYKVTMLDGIIFFVEFVIVVTLFFTIQYFIEKLKKKNKRSLQSYINEENDRSQK